MIKKGKIQKENIRTIYFKIKKESKEKGCTEEETKSLLLKFLSEEDIKECERINLNHVEDLFNSRLEELNKIKNKVNILAAVMDYNHYLCMTDFNPNMTKGKYDKINSIYDALVESGMKSTEIIESLKEYLTSEDIETLIKYVEVEENMDIYEEYIELSERIKLDENKGHRVRKFAKSWKL